MARVILFSAALILITSALGSIATSLGCNITVQDWTSIYTALGERYYYKELQTSNLCLNATLNGEGLPAHYGSCTGITLEKALANQQMESNCRTFLEGKLYTGEGEDKETAKLRSIEICSKESLAKTVNSYLCNPLRTVGCPRQVDIAIFAVFAKCHVTALTNMTVNEQKIYFEEKKDITCMINNNVCSDLVGWKTCPVEVQTVLDFIDEAKKYTCQNMFPTVENRCQNTYAENFELYCPPPTILEANLYTIVITCTVGPVAILFLILCYKKVYRAQHISSAEVLKQAQEIGESSNSVKLYHPELAAVVASKYKGVSFNPATGEWSVAGKQEKFQDEQAAARFAYINLAGLSQPGKSAVSSSHTSYSTPRSAVVSNDFPVAAYNQEETEYVVTGTPMSPEQIKQRRLQQLIGFYEFWEPTKTDIPAHAENLLNRHDFEHVARAVKTKYGVLPPGWAEELEV